MISDCPTSVKQFFTFRTVSESGTGRQKKGFAGCIFPDVVDCPVFFTMKRARGTKRNQPVPQAIKKFRPAAGIGRCVFVGLFPIAFFRGSSFVFICFFHAFPRPLSWIQKAPSRDDRMVPTLQRQAKGNDGKRGRWQVPIKEAEAELKSVCPQIKNLSRHQGARAEPKPGRRYLCDTRHPASGSV